MSKTLRLLVLEDNVIDADLMIRELRRAGYEPVWTRVETEDGFVAALAAAPELILADYTLPRYDGLRAVQHLRERGLDIPFILVSGMTGEDAAVEAMKEGATDYLLKDRIARLGPAVERALEARRLRRERTREEEARRESEARWRLATSVAGLGSWERDFLTNRITWSAEQEQLMGYAPGTFPGTYAAFYELVHPEDRGQLAAAQMDAQQQGGAYRAELRFRLRDGRVRWGLVLGHVMHDESGHPLRMVGVELDISERKLAEEALRASREQLRTFAHRLQVIREEERTHIAREIHDVLAQELTRLKLDLSWLGRRVAHPVDESTRAGLADKVASMMELADVTLESVQKLATDLRPVVLDSLGLGPAIEWLAEDFQARTGLRCTVHVDAALPKLERAEATALFRIVQESLTNVVRHAGANRVEVTLGAPPGALQLTVQDDGRGITAAELADMRSIGLLGMRERAAVLGGRTEIAPVPGGGTRVTVTTPLRPPTSETPS